MKKCMEMREAILTDAKNEELQEHLRSCVDCRSFAEDYRRIRNAAVKPFDRTPPESVEAAIRAHAERAALTYHFRSRRNLRLKFWIPAAACLCACFLILHYDGRPTADASLAERSSVERSAAAPLSDSELNAELAFVAYDVERALDELSLSENDLLEDQFAKDYLVAF